MSHLRSPSARSHEATRVSRAAGADQGGAWSQDGCTFLAPSLAGFKARLDGALSTLGWWEMSLIMAGGGTR